MNKLLKLTSSLFFAAGLLSSATVFAHNGEDHSKDKPPASAADSAKASYPLTTCVVSGDSLAGGDMGPPIDYIHKRDGKPDRLVRLCCKSCIKKFNQDPAKYLKMIDDAAGEKAADTNGHAEHKH